MVLEGNKGDIYVPFLDLLSNVVNLMYYCFQNEVDTGHSGELLNAVNTHILSTAGLADSG